MADIEGGYKIGISITITDTSLPTPVVEKLPSQPFTILSTAVCSQGDYYNELLIEEGTPTQQADKMKATFGKKIDKHIAIHTSAGQPDLMFFAHETFYAKQDPYGILGSPNDTEQ